MADTPKQPRRDVLLLRTAPAMVDATPTLLARLPCELIDMIVDRVLLDYDLFGRRHSQVRLRRQDPSPEDLLQASDHTTLLTMAHVNHSFRVRTLAYLWKNVRFNTVKDVDMYDVFFAASSKGDARMYGSLVQHVDFLWTCKPQGSIGHGLLSTYQFWMQRGDTLARCAFTKRTERATAELAKNPTLPQSWYTWTDGPDGNGVLPRLKRPIDLVRALIRIFRHFPNLVSLRWDGSVLPLPLPLSQAIERTATSNFHDLTVINGALPLRG